MIEIKEIKTPLDTKMIEINLERADSNNITQEHIQKALDLLLQKGEKVIHTQINNATPQLQGEILNDYIFTTDNNGKKDYIVNFACCFLRYSDAKKLAANNGILQALQALQALRGDRFSTHPLYYKDYAKLLYEKQIATQKLLENQN